MSGEGVLQQILVRIRAHGRTKVALSAAAPVAFVGCYLLAQRAAIGPARPVPQIALDTVIPFRPDAVFLYESLWLLQGVAPWLMTDRRQLESYLRALCALSAITMVFFVLCPTANPRPADPGATNALYRGLIRIDSELNAFPSLHAAFAVYSAFGCGQVFSFLPRWHGLLTAAAIWAWATGILAATLLTKQHAVVDLIAGAALGGSAYLLHRRSLRTAAPSRVAVAESAGDPG